VKQNINTKDEEKQTLKNRILRLVTDLLETSGFISKEAFKKNLTFILEKLKGSLA
jgi:hypothetical protein